MKLTPSARTYMKALGKRGGKARWKGASASDKSAHARKMLRARYAKRVTAQTLNRNGALITLRGNGKNMALREMGLLPKRKRNAA